MTALLWTALWLARGLPETRALQPPTRLNLTSDHLVHSLTWEPGAGNPGGVFYQVSVVDERGTSWAPVAGCQHVQRLLFCNLTEAFPDDSENYFIKVWARLPPHEAFTDRRERFSPARDTRLDLPLVDLSACGWDLCVDLRPARQHLRNIYDSLCYQLRTEDGDGRVQSEEDFRSLSRRTVKGLARGRRYCVSVRFWDGLCERKSNFSRPQCAFTAGGPGQDWWVAALSVVVLVLVVPVLVVLALLLYNRVILVRRSTLPSVLTTVRAFRPVRLLRQHAASLSSIEALPWVDRGVVSAPPPGWTEGYQARVKTCLLSSSASCSLPSEPSADLGLAPGSEEESYKMRPEPLTARRLGLGHVEDEVEEEEEEEEGGVQEVELFSLTFGREVEEKEDNAAHLDQEGILEEAAETWVLQEEDVVCDGEDAFVYLRRM